MSSRFRGRGVSAAFMAVALMTAARASWALSPQDPADVEPPSSPLSDRHAPVVVRVPPRVALRSEGRRAFEHFASIQPGSWDAFVKSLRPAAVSANRKARALASVRKEDLILPSALRQAKLDALQPVLKYLDRDTVVDVKILRLDLAWAGFLDGAAVLVSEGAIDLLTADELQAVVAHELAHEYFASEYEAGRKAKRYDTVKEIELRCDAISILTMSRLGLDPSALLSAVAKLTRFNDDRGFPNNRNLVPSVEERRSFSRAVVALIQEEVAARRDEDASNR